MSSFVTNAATRRGKKAKTIRTTYQNLLANGGPPAPKRVLPATDESITASETRKITTNIGSADSSGLVIHGNAYNEGRYTLYNPDGRNPPLDASENDTTGGGTPVGTTLVYPDYPVSFAGPGYMKFTNPIKLPVIQGDVEITGTLTAELAALSNIQLVSGITIVGETSGSLNVTAVGYYIKLGALTYCDIRLVTTTPNTMVGPVIIQGLPFTSNSPSSGLSQVFHFNEPVLEDHGSILILAKYSSGHTLRETKTDSTVESEDIDPSKFGDGNIFIRGLFL